MSTLSARHIASPLPTTGPNSGSSVAWSKTSAPSRAAIAPVPSARRRVDDDDLVDDPALAQRQQRLDDAGDRRGLLARRDADRDRLRRAAPADDRPESPSDGSCAATPRSYYLKRLVRRPRHPALERPAGRRPRRRAARARGVRGRAHGGHGAAARHAAPALLEALRARRDRDALQPPGRGARGRLGGPDDRHDRHRVRQVAVLQPADARRPVPRREGARAVPLSDEGARPGPGARDQRVRPRPSRCAPRSTTATRAREQRTQIRRRANLVLTNPDMLHMGILPHHRAWGDFFSNLAVVVVDEAHVYRGVFGSHVANVLRRLRRIANAYGTTPRFLLASATIANPVELAERLTGLDEIALVDRDGSPGARRQIAMWNPPLTDEALGTRASALGEAAEIVDRARAPRRAHDLLHQVAQGGRARRAARRARGPRPQGPRRPLPRRLHAAAAPRARGQAHARRAARGHHDRRARARHRHRRAGCGGRRDVPRARSRRCGRCGAAPGAAAAASRSTSPARTRWTSSSAAIPTSSSTAPVEAAILEYENEQIHLAHLLCAAHEGPLSAADAETLGPRWERTRRRSSPPGELVAARRRVRPAPPRGLSGRARVAALGVAGHVRDRRRAATASCSARSRRRASHTTVHDGAVYLHQARPYIVRGLDLDTRRALVEPFTGDFYTQPKKETMTDIEALLDRRSTLGVTLSFGRVNVTDQVLAYQRKKLPDARDRRPPERSTCPRRRSRRRRCGTSSTTTCSPTTSRWRCCSARCTPPSTRRSRCCRCWRCATAGTSAACRRTTTRRPAGRRSSSTTGIPAASASRARAFSAFETLVADAYRLIAECPCERGCPSCVQSPKCGNLNEPLHKAGALEVMARMLER